MKRLSKVVRENWAVLLVFFLQIPLILPFFHKGFFPSHDNVQVVRVFEIFQSVKYGDFPPRWSANLLFGRGYPLYVFYAPLPFLIGAVPAFLKLNFLLSTKAVFVLSFFMGGVGIYFLVKEWWGKAAGLVSAIAFSYAPYRAVDVYVRGNLGEFFAFSLFPWVFWLNWKFLTINNTSKKRWGLIFCLFLFFQEISHNISCFIFFIFLLFFNVFYLVVYEKKYFWKTVFDSTKVLSLSLVLSAFFWIPLFYESRFVIIGKFANSPYQDYFLTLGRAWNSNWGWGGYLDPGNALSLSFGKTLIVFSLLAVLVNFSVKHKFKKLNYFFFFSLLFFLFLEVKGSLFIWEKISLLHYLQFPWRFHILTVTLMAILCGSLMYLVEIKFSRQLRKNIRSVPFLILLSSSLILENIGLFKPQYFSDAPAVSETTTWDDEYLPKWVKTKPKDFTGEKIKFVEGEGKILNEEWGYLSKKFKVAVESEKAMIEIAHIYYPGWKVFVDEKELSISYDNPFGVMRVAVSKGTSGVEFTFVRTKVRLISELLSVGGFLLFILLFFFFKSKPLEKKIGKKL